MKSDEVGGCIGGVVMLAFFLWLAGPPADQVCRQHSVPIWDNITGTADQPTCQHLIDQIEAQARHADEKASELESRLVEVESRLNM